MPTVVRSQTVYQKTEGVAETKSERYQQCSCDEKSFFKRKRDARESTIRISKHERSLKKGGLKENNACECDD